MNIKERAQQLKLVIPIVFLALKKKEMPVTAKFLAGITVAYALSPVDLIPDFVPVLGYLDDVIILPFLVALTVKSIPKDVFDQCQMEAQGLWGAGKPENSIAPYLLR